MKNQQKYLAALLAVLLVTSTAFGLVQSAAPTRALSATDQQLVDRLSERRLKKQ